VTGMTEAAAGQPAAVAFVLASGSQGRLRVLRDAGMDPEGVVSGAYESSEISLATADLVQDLAERKAAAVASQRPQALVLGCENTTSKCSAPSGESCA
jgi:predicted house-cleaning NTP pyrophosphatase (Maf/HAM1 superfamily)